MRKERYGLTPLRSSPYDVLEGFSTFFLEPLSLYLKADESLPLDIVFPSSLKAVNVCN